jgi:hypothetical protein
LGHTIMCLKEKQDKISDRVEIVVIFDQKNKNVLNL